MVARSLDSGQDSNVARALCRTLLKQGAGLISTLLVPDVGTALATELPQTSHRRKLGDLFLPVGSEIKEISEPAASYFENAVWSISSTMDPRFTARLVVYRVSSRLPSGIPGDPARDYGRNSKRQCGKFAPSSDRPYEICPMTNTLIGSRLTDAQNQCCRHFAFCVPYSESALAVEDRVSTVVVSERLFNLPENSWKAILAHELGHSIDFWVFGSRYRLRDHQLPMTIKPEVRNEILKVNDEEKDPEIRADILGELFVLKPRGKRLCYSSTPPLQTVVDSKTPCDGSLMTHFSHPPIQGKLRT